MLVDGAGWVDVTGCGDVTVCELEVDVFGVDVPDVDDASTATPSSNCSQVSPNAFDLLGPGGNAQPPKNTPRFRLESNAIA